MNARMSAQISATRVEDAATHQLPPIPTAFTPSLVADDPLAESWLAEATLRLRREIGWLWHQRGRLRAADDSEPRGLPPTTEDLFDSLEFGRFEAEKRRMFATDPTAVYLSERIATLRETRVDIPGPWLAIVDRLGLDESAQLVLALGLLARVDPASGAVFAACRNDVARTAPTLALAQRLYADPGSMQAFNDDSAQALFRHALLIASAEHSADATIGWHQGFEASGPIADAILHDDGRMPMELRMPASGATTIDVPREVALAASPMQEALRGPQFLPLQGDRGSDFGEWATALAALHGRRLLALRADPLPEPARLAAIAAWCWLYDVDVLLPLQCRGEQHGHDRPSAWPQTPVRWLVPMHDPHAANALPQAALGSAIRLPSTDFDTRLRRFDRALGAHAQRLRPQVEEMARRYRFDPSAIDAVGVAAARFGEIDGETLQQLCRAQTRLDLGSLAQRVEPRFRLDEMVLPPAQALQLAEIAQAMRALTEVHYRWGTARAWNDAGLSVVFCGPPGTGKTMAAEALAHELELPMFRIDLSQVVNKYIGETEKNLKRVFDAAEESDCIIFFDEADALFGKRTSVKDAHDRFANIEISYLLERMERLKGIAVLATNRRKDLDEAFLRRLRYLVEFPLPGERERELLWRQVFPQGVDTGDLDFAALARLFPLAGGHIRSIAFNACLQAARGGAAQVGMLPVLCAVKRELDKLNRPNSPENFGPFQEQVRPLFTERNA